MEPMQVAENGSFAIIGDPGGAGIGAWQADQVTGFEIWNEPGAPRWFELHTRNYDASVDFYRDVFGWNTNTYSDRRSSATRRFAPALTTSPGSWTRRSTCPRGAAPFWTIYFGVDDTDAALERVVELGGKVDAARQGHAVGSARTGCRSHRHLVQADGASS